MATAHNRALAHLKECSASLSGTEQRVVMTILADPAKAMNESINELAQRCEVSDSTIVRTCKRLGYDGFPQLKLALAMDLAGSPDPAQSPKFMGHVEVGDPLDAVVHKVFGANMLALQRTLQQINIEQFSRAVDAILSARTLAVFSSGTQAHLVDHCVSKLVLTGIQCAGRTDHLQQTSLAAVMQPTDALLIFNHSGRLRSLVEAAELARSRGVTTIAFTNFAQSPLARAVDICVTTHGDDLVFYSESMGSEAAQMVLADCLLVAIASRRGEVVIPNFRAQRKAIENLRL